MAKRNFELKFLAYLDAEETNNPKDVIISSTETLSGDIGEEQVCRIDEIPQSTTDSEIQMGFSDAKFILIKNLGTITVDIKLNSASNTPFTLSAGNILYLESVSTAGAGLISSVFVTNADPTTAAKIKLFASN